MRLAYTMALLLLLILACYVLLPGRNASAAKRQGVRKEAARNNVHASSAEANADGAVESSRHAIPRHVMREAPGGWSEAAVHLDNAKSYRTLAALAEKHGVGSRWHPGLKRMLLNGSKPDILAMFEEPLLSGLQPEYNISLLMIPEKEENVITADGMPFFNSALKWIGVDSNSENRGKGVKIALLDSSVDRSAACLNGVKISSSDLFGLEGKNYVHGTQVASLLAGSGSVTGVVPSAEILSIPVLDSDGYGDVFSLAEAIVAATDAGADIISMSLGFYHESSLLKDAVEYARGKGCAIVASAGNEGMSPSGKSTVCYPGAFEGVIAVGAVNAGGTRAGFSSTGPEIDISAPGVGLIADNGENAVFFSGTSAATPLVSGTLAYIMSTHEGMTADEASGILLANANDAGMPGKDYEYGKGTVDAARSINYDTPGIFDAAAASIVAGKDENGEDAYFFTAQNRGTEDISALTLSCSLLTDAGVISSLATFNDVKAGQTAYALVKMPDGNVEARGATLEVSTTSDDSHRENDRLIVP